MKPRQLLRRLFKSQWVQIFGSALILLEILTVVAVAVTGNWFLLLAFPILVAFFLFRAIFIGFVLFFPVLVAAIVVWAAYTLFKEKPQKKAHLETSTGNGARTSERAQ